jgi:hypothetical protein
MLVEMNTVAQAAKVAELTGGVHLATKPPKDGHMGMSRCVDVGDGFEPHRQTVESVSVLSNCTVETVTTLRQYPLAGRQQELSSRSSGPVSPSGCR